MGRYHGYGTMTYSNRSEYKGQWKSDEKTGKGEQTWPDGSHYVGDFVNFNKEGQGKHVFSNGAEYEGAWKNGQQHGVGTFTPIAGEGPPRLGTWEEGKEIENVTPSFSRAKAEDE